MSDIIIQDPALIELTVNDTDETVTLNITDAIQLSDYLKKDTIITKGDLIVGDASGVPVRLPAGTNGYFLQADNTEAKGLKFTNNLDGGNF